MKSNPNPIITYTIFRVRQFHDDSGVNHYNIIQIKGRAACLGQPKLRDDGSVKY